MFFFGRKGKLCSKAAEECGLFSGAALLFGRTIPIIFLSKGRGHVRKMTWGPAGKLALKPESVCTLSKTAVADDLFRGPNPGRSGGPKGHQARGFFNSALLRSRSNTESGPLFPRNRLKKAVRTPWPPHRAGFYPPKRDWPPGSGEKQKRDRGTIGGSFCCWRTNWRADFKKPGNSGFCGGPNRFGQKVNNQGDPQSEKRIRWRWERRNTGWARLHFQGGLICRQGVLSYNKRKGAGPKRPRFF